MSRLYKYRIKAILGDKGNMFWTLIFPIMMATLFYFSFGQIISSAEQFQPVPVAVVGEAGSFSQALEQSSEGDDGLFHLTRTSAEQAQALLSADAVDGIFFTGKTPSLTVKNEGLSQSILKNFLDSYLQIESTIESIARKDPALVPQAIAVLQSPQSGLTEVSFSDGSLNFMQDNFFSLIAMTCLYGSFFGLTGALNLQPGLSVLGTRRNITPTRKLSIVLSDTLASVTVMMGIVAVLLLYMRYALGIRFGANMPAVLLATLAGVFVGVALGMFVGLVLRMSSRAKEGLLVALVLTLCFFSGLMYPGMRSIIDQNAPLINQVNPAALITDAFYALDMYGVGGRYWMNIALLAVIGALLCAGSAAMLRRKQYASL